MKNDLGRIVDALPGLIWTALPDGRADYLNHRWCEYTGLSFENALGLGWHVAIHPEDLPALFARWQSFVASGQPGEVEGRLRRFDGQYRRFQFRFCPITDASGQIVKWCGVNTDIEDLRETEEALLASERQYRLIFDGLPALVIVMAPDGTLVHANRYCLEYFGATLEELQRRGQVHSYHPDDYPTVLACWRRSIETGQAYESEGRRRRADGTYRWFHTRGFPLRDADGRIVLWYSLATDVDDLKGAEEELRRSEAELRRANRFLSSAQELSQTGSFTRDVSTDEQHLSDQMYRIMEFDPAKKVTHDMVLGRIHPEDLPTFEAVLGAALKAGEDYQIAFRIVTGNGAVKHLRTHTRRILEIKDRLVYLGSTQDVTEIKQAEEALNQARAEFAHAARVLSLGTLTASIAHEVNQPLSGIITNAGTCLRMLAADPPNVEGARETAKRTIRDGNRASEVIARLRSLFEKKSTATEPVDLNEAAREVIALTLSELQRKQVVLKSEFADDLPSAMGDRVQLQQVILNLLLNASDAMSGIEDRPRQLAIKTERGEPDHVRVIVRDVGVGIDPLGVNKLFDAFYTTKSGGMGIGLSVSRSIIESHNGRLWATPNDGPGATFAFSIPRGAERKTGALA